MQGCVKSMNESIYYCVDYLHRAIAENRQISFEYMKWNLPKNLVSKRFDPCIVSPWALILIAYDEQDNCLKNFRVDKMKSFASCRTSASGMTSQSSLPRKMAGRRPMSL